jgi:hypothetical protein
MAVFYRGAGVGTYWHAKDARLFGFIPQSPGSMPSPDSIMHHIARATVTSRFVSMTRSYGVAKDYAINASRILPSSSNPAYVYKIEIDDPSRYGVELVDPIIEIAKHLPNPPCDDLTYHHDGAPSFLLGVIDPFGRNNHHLTALIEQPPGSAGTPRAANLTIQLETLVRALRDSEVLASGAIPTTCIVGRFDVS